ncbi:response regulator transcription factor [Clostridium estertheticum]|uniref:response regulator transcription factor n=1 Tax=Clostridium estertheticum TaxID=238834 RepID=UPI001C0B8FE4|nr:response regulator transcription factor [Clostridium estertheticum]MBU3214819.1 response regulator transcription factor [Clostridium estertheticum]WAG57227.1 response regulator transcription factor [Clostridium estertheticum]
MDENEFSILIVEDDEQINDALKIYLLREGYNTLQAYDGKEALDIFTLELVDLILLDISLPKIDGIEVLKQVRSISDVPIVMLTVFSKEYNKLQSFELGADDYITKPFSLKEVAARIQAVLKRMKKVNRTQRSYINVGKIRINPFTREVFVDVNEISLTKKEFDLLFILVNNYNMTFSREKLLEKIWNDKDVNDFRTVDTHIKQLREKLGHEKGCIQTVWGVGYKLKVMKSE